MRIMNPNSQDRRAKLLLTGSLAILWAGVFAPVAQAENLVNAQVNASMDGGGTAEVPSTYLLTDGFARTGLKETYVGRNDPYNSFRIEEGASATSTEISYIGFNVGSDGNRAVVTGVGSRWTITKKSLSVGLRGSHNSLEISDGGQVLTAGGNYVGGSGHFNTATITGAGSNWTAQAGDIGIGSGGVSATSTNNQVFVLDGGLLQAPGNGFIGQGSAATANQVTVDGVGSRWVNGGTLIIGKLSASGNHLTVSNGGFVSNTAGTVGEDYTQNNSTTVTGAGSIWENTGTLLIGAGSNLLTVADGGLVSVEGSTLSINSGSYLRLDGGFLAWSGNRESSFANLVTLGRVQLFDGSAWVTAAADELRWDYLATDAAAEAFTGGLYDGLGGYTILSTIAVPEPSTYALIGIGLALMLFKLRQRRARIV